MADDATGPTTPPPPPLVESEQSASGHASYVPHDLQYNADFEDSVMSLILSSQASPDKLEDELDEPSLLQQLQQRRQDGIVVPLDNIDMKPRAEIYEDSDGQRILPTFGEEELPLALDDSRRTFASRIPGIRLTHPGGYFEGGPGLDPDMDTFPEDFISHHAQARTVPQLRSAIEREIESSLDLLRGRVRARRKAMLRNEQVQKDLKLMSDEHSMELKIHKKQCEERRAKKEAKEKRRAERES